MLLNEFITELEKELKVLPEPRRKEIIEDFKMQIQKAMELGDTEEYLLKILGDPRKVAEKFIADEIIQKPEEEITAEPAEIKEEKVKSRQAVTGNFASELKDINISQLTINGETAEIKVESGKKFGIKFLSYTHKGKLEYEINNNQLTIHHSGTNDVKFNTIIDFMKKRKQLKKDELVIIWPHKLDMITIDNKDGKVTINDIEAEEFRIKTKEGGIYTAGLTGNYGEFTSSMGTLKVESSDFRNLYMETEMGRIVAGGVKAERYHLITELGKISLDNLTPDSDLKALSKMGSVNVNYRSEPRFTKIVTRANVGKVKNALENNKIAEQLYRAEYMSEMGSVKITLS
ncbi:hypothetical protein GCM10007275_21680 [Jeotgalicoccus coquinae]|uniref:DUF4097 domain-containing protein n=1 Tax=Jeotgalicoccus coquinae TaxID=709509 RepID=A0A6V7RR73_9STAP|nr:DUF4097 family beta strand repeat-containing protein [Jeotgalicoccus coquinae]MBB6424128.1 hypothetical protein [Jeotgalicoccus coquinae]GGE26299.1 hypothetical protein GCM10007275_21680 [Jeotgalicoccus coquinae]CAD2081348.1 hypothetical protein JEOCOQ751_01919 [Jeotgalicoccus coquinae]